MESRQPPSAEMALAWEALEQGRPSELDIMLLKHELEELTLMETEGYTYDVAHLYSDMKYPWEYLVEGGWTDDSIKASIEERLKKYL